MTDYCGLVAEVPRKHLESRWVPGRCCSCLETWPCLTRRLAEALEQTQIQASEIADYAAELIAQREIVQARADRLAGELAWYAAEDNYLGHCPAALDDLGAQARAALGVVPRGDHPALTTPPICGNTGLTEAVEAGFRSIRASKGESPDGGCGKQLGWLHAYRCLECGRWMHAECLRQHFAEHGDALSLALARVERLVGALKDIASDDLSACSHGSFAVAALGLAAHKDLASPSAPPDGFSE
jgi:hypothetical protein